MFESCHDTNDEGVIQCIQYLDLVLCDPPLGGKTALADFGSVLALRGVVNTLVNDTKLSSTQNLNR